MASGVHGDPNMWRLAGRYSALGIEIAASVTFGTLAGVWLDGQLGTTPYLFWFGVVVGCGAATTAITRTIRAYRREQAGRNA